MEHPFLREEMALGTAALERLSHSHVAVFGIGGVGSFTVEALALSLIHIFGPEMQISPSVLAGSSSVVPGFTIL